MARHGSSTTATSPPPSDRATWSSWPAPTPYTFADAPGPGAADDRPSGAAMPRRLRARSLAEAMSLGVRTWGNNLDGSSTVLLGHVRAAHRGRPALPRRPPAADRAARRGVGLPGGVTAGRRRSSATSPARRSCSTASSTCSSSPCCERGSPAPSAPPWYRAHSDPVRRPGPAAAAPQPGAPVDGRRAGVAGRVVAGGARPPVHRARRRAADDVSSPAGAWRSPPTCSASRARRVGAVADEVGYGSPFALSTAFKRHRGMSPQQYRAAV